MDAWESGPGGIFRGRHNMRVATSLTCFFAWSMIVTSLGSIDAAKPADNNNNEERQTTLEEVTQRLQSETRIPIRIPKFLPETGGQKIFAVVTEVGSWKYDVLLATKLPCEGGNACTYGTVQGNKSPLDPIEGKSISVHLKQGIVGHFFASRCFSFCSQAYIRWQEGGVYYSIGVKAAKKGPLLQAAKSAMQTQQISPNLPQGH